MRKYLAVTTESLDREGRKGNPQRSQSKTKAEIIGHR